MSMRDMTAVSLPAVGSANLDADVKNHSDKMCMSISDNKFLSLSKESMEQIRNTMLQHEILFKEQVQALHRLYNVQKAAMQEIRKFICCPSHLSASIYDTNEAHNVQIHSSVEEGKTIQATVVNGEDYVEDSHVLSMCPSAFVEYSGKIQKTFTVSNMEGKVLPTFQNKVGREIDLERPPEEYMDDSDYQIGSNNFDIQDPNVSSYSFMGHNQSITQSGSYGALSKSSKEASQNFGFKSDMDSLKCKTSFQSTQDAFRRNMLQGFAWNHLPLIGNCSVNGDLSLSLNQHERKPSGLLQQSTLSTDQRLSSACNSELFENKLHPERKASKQVKISSLSQKNVYSSGPSQLHQFLESNSNMTAPCLTLDQQLQQHSVACLPSDEALLPSNHAMYPQVTLTRSSTLFNTKGSSIVSIEGVPSEVMNLPLGDHNSPSWILGCRTGRDDGNENPNCSGHGSNSPTSQGEKACGDGAFSTAAVKSVECGSDMGTILASHLKMEGLESEPKEGPDSTNNTIKHSLSSSIPVESAVDCPETHRNGEEPAAMKSNEEEVENESTVEEPSESIAAKILLSFAPCRSQRQCFDTQAEMESSRSSRESADNGKKQNRRARKGVNYSNGVGMDAVKWTKSVRGRRRRTARRQR